MVLGGYKGIMKLSAIHKQEYRYNQKEKGDLLKLLIMNQAVKNAW
jgi:hypothetical protein